MTTNSQDKNDTKLLLAVAAVVVAGAVGLALVAGLSADRETAPNTVSATPASRSVPARAARPSVEPPPFAALEKVPGTVDAETEIAATELIHVDPSADFVAVGAQAYSDREYLKAVAYFEAEAEARPGRAWTHYMLGLARWKSGQLDDAVDSMERSAELNPGAVKTMINLSRIQNDRDEFSAALEAAERAIEQNEVDAEAHFLRGRSLRNLGQVDEAIEALRRSIELEPDNGYARNLLGLTYIGLNLDGEAVEQLQRAAELVPEVAYVQNNLGMALELAGRRDEAIAAYRRAAELDSHHFRSVANLARLESSLPSADPTESNDEGTVLASSEPPAEPTTESPAEPTTEPEPLADATVSR
jgi:tetratricopeptide (TPR) repeat protein